jgi:hypothetical protein
MITQAQLTTVDGYLKFSSKAEAKKVARRLGISGTHSHKMGSKTIHMPGSNHRTLNNALVKKGLPETPVPNSGSGSSGGMMGGMMSGMMSSKDKKNKRKKTDDGMGMSGMMDMPSRQDLLKDGLFSAKDDSLEDGKGGVFAEVTPDEGESLVPEEDVKMVDEPGVDGRLLPEELTGDGEDDDGDMRIY